MPAALKRPMPILNLATVLNYRFSGVALVANGANTRLRIHGMKELVSIFKKPLMLLKRTFILIKSLVTAHLKAPANKYPQALSLFPKPGVDLPQPEILASRGSLQPESFNKPHRQFKI